MLAYLLCVACLLCSQGIGAQKDESIKNDSTSTTRFVASPATSSVPLISVEFTVVNDLIGNHFKNSIFIQVREGSTLLQVMEKAAELKPKEFSFQFQDYTWGVYITAINQLSGSNNEKTYWQFFSGNSPLAEGVSDYIPRNKEHIIAVYSKF